TVKQERISRRVLRVKRLDLIRVSEREHHLRITVKTRFRFVRNTVQNYRFQPRWNIRIQLRRIFWRVEMRRLKSLDLAVGKRIGERLKKRDADRKYFRPLGTR